MPEPEEIDLEDLDESYTAGDEEILFTDEVLVLAKQIEAINAIDNGEAQLEAAKAWVKELNGEV